MTAGYMGTFLTAQTPFASCLLKSRLQHCQSVVAAFHSGLAKKSFKAGFVAFPRQLEEKRSRRLDKDLTNPIGITAHFLREFFTKKVPEIDGLVGPFRHYECPNEAVSVRDNFDELQVPLDHVTRSPRETFYTSQEYVESFPDLCNKYNEFLKKYNSKHYDTQFINALDDKFHHSQIKVLPTHTTSRLPQLLRDGYTSATYCGQVYRRDEIDSQHYPIFHQFDGFCTFTNQQVKSLAERYGSQQGNISYIILEHLKDALDSLISFLFSKLVKTSSGNEDNALELKWDSDTSFPFTDPSLELYIKSGDDKWIEILGCGQIKRIILDNLLVSKPGNDPVVGGWAFGIGLERLAMILCNIDDIRQFWETDERFTNQYKDSIENGCLTEFKPYSRNPPVIRDISFFVPAGISGTELRDKIVNVAKKAAGQLLESMTLVDIFEHSKEQKTSLCFRLEYRAMGANLKGQDVNVIHAQVEAALVKAFDIKIR